jgi:TM2 domain-containing membrane protein YozV
MPGAPAAAGISPMSRLATSLLAIFLGQFGAHRFYVGKTGTAVVMLILGIVGWATIWIFGLGLLFLIPVHIWAIIDFIFAVVGKMTDSQGLLIEKW